MGKLTTEDFDVTDSIAFGTLTMLVIEIPASANTFSYGTTDSGNRFSTIAIDKLGLSEIFGASIMTMGSSPLSIGFERMFANNNEELVLKPLDAGNTKDLNLGGLNTGALSVNVEPLVYIDNTETNLIIDMSFKEFYAVNNGLGGVNSKAVRLTVIGRR